MSGWANSGSGLDLVSESDGFAEQQDGAAPGMGFCVQDEKAVDGADTRAFVRVPGAVGCRLSGPSPVWQEGLYGFELRPPLVPSARPARRSASAMAPLGGLDGASPLLRFCLAGVPLGLAGVLLGLAGVSRGGRAWPPGSSSRRRVSEIRLRAASTLRTFTRTTSPDLTTSRGSETKFRDIADTCTRPS